METGFINAALEASKNGYHLNPKINLGFHYQHWINVDDSSRCPFCGKMHGKVWLIDERPFPKPPVHFCCRCKIQNMETIEAGTATINGANGADWTLLYQGILPAYYVSFHEAKRQGRRLGKSPSNFIRENFSTKKELSFYTKIYNADAAFNSIRRPDNRIDPTHNMENIVYNELIYMGYDIWVYNNAGRHIPFKKFLKMNTLAD